MKRYNLSRALLHSKDLNCPEAEEHFRIFKADQDLRVKLNIASGVNKPFKSSIRAPFEAFVTRDLSATGSVFNGGFLVGTKIPFIQQALRPSSLLMKLPIMVIEGMSAVVQLPRLSAGTSATPLSELQLLNSADPSFGSTGAGPARLSVQTTLSKQLIAQAASNDFLDEIVKRDLMAAVSQKLDNELINGQGTAGDISGIPNEISVLNSFSFGAAASWPKFVSAQQTLETSFIDSDSACYLIGPATAGKLRQALKGTSTAKFIFESGMIGDIPAYVSTFAGVSEQVILGDWSNLAVAIWGGGFDITVDPYTKAGSGEVVVTVLLFYNGYVRRPQAFVLSSDSGAQ